MRGHGIMRRTAGALHDRRQRRQADAETGARLRDLQRDRLCDVLEAAGPDAPTLCTGWTAGDLAAHLWILDHDPVGWIGVGIGPLERIHTARIARARDRMPHGEILAALRAGDGSLACMPTDAREGHRHALGEYAVHTQDVLRAAEGPWPIASQASDRRLDSGASDDSDLAAAMDEALWRRARVAGGMLHVLSTRGLVLQHPDGRVARATPGRERVRVVGAPLELLLWVHGRASVADVEVLRDGA